MTWLNNVRGRRVNVSWVVKGEHRVTVDGILEAVGRSEPEDGEPLPYELAARKYLVYDRNGNYVGDFAVPEECQVQYMAGPPEACVFWVRPGEGLNVMVPE